jgi:hypothetical protein
MQLPTFPYTVIHEILHDTFILDPKAIYLNLWRTQKFPIKPHAHMLTALQYSCRGKKGRKLLSLFSKNDYAKKLFSSLLPPPRDSIHNCMRICMEMA